jgi:hypothetical protein
MANSGAPRSTKSPGRAINLLTLPENGEKTGVVVSSLIAILPSVARSSRKATWRTGASLRLDHCVSLGRKEPSVSPALFSGRASALPGTVSSAQKPITAAAATTAPPAATHRRFRLRRAVNEGLGCEGMNLAVLSACSGDGANLVLSDYVNLTGP